jgi:uncharacterized protein (TIGR03435 family)
VRLLFLAIVLMQVTVLTSFSQTGSLQSKDAPKHLSFDVISVKLDKGDARRRGSQFTSDGFAMVNTPVHNLLTQALHKDPDEIIGEPGWATTDRWDVVAKVLSPEDVATLGKMSFAQRGAMLLQILTDRFGLKTHHETRELPVYALVVAKGGLKMVESKSDPGAPPNGGSPKLMGPDGKLTGQEIPLDFLAQELAWQVGRTVVDRTGLAGRYDFSLTWTPDSATGAGAGAGDGSQTAGESIFTAVQEQLGLKLQPTKAPVDVVVIDRLEKPSEN